MSETKILASYVVNGTLPRFRARCCAKRAARSSTSWAARWAAPRDEAVDAAMRAFRPFSGAPTANVLGRDERLDPLHASLMNGISSHVYDYDDTTPKNYCHPTSPIASALFAYASVNPVRGRDFMEAFIYGFEASSRVANCVYPTHYDLGWHITGTAGVFGAAAAIGKLMRLTEPQMIWALGLAGTQAAGVREMFGSMGKAFHPGPRGAERLRGRAPRAGGVHLGPAHPRGPARFPGGHHRREVQPRQRDQGARHRVRSPGEHLQAVPVRHRHPPDDRRRHPAARAARLCPGRHHGGAAARGAAGARPLQPAGHHQGSAGQVLRLPWRGDRAGARARGRAANTPTRR